MSTARIAFTIVAALLEIIIPLIVAFVVGRRLGVRWKYFGYGALIFLLFQLITRVPLVQVLQGLFGQRLLNSTPLLVGWLAVLSLTAGLAEEIGRYVGYRWLMRGEEKTWPKAVMYGLGHGGLESMVLVAGLTLVGLINVLALSTMNLDTLPISPEQRAQIAQQLAAVRAQPSWLPLVGVWERVWAIAFHVALSVIVLQIFRRGSMRWLWLAIAIHALVDFVATGVPLMLGLKGTAAIVVPEATITVAGLAGLWAVRRLRDRPSPGVPLDVGTPTPADPDTLLPQ